MFQTIQRGDQSFEKIGLWSRLRASFVKVVSNEYINGVYATFVHMQAKLGHENLVMIVR